MNDKNIYNNKNLLIEGEGVFGNFAADFDIWRIKRAEKLVNIFGLKWFKNKKILEMGCGFGHIGMYFNSLGSVVHFSDAREEVLEKVKEKKPDAITFVIDQEEDWSSKHHYDLIIHFGILYNLNYWEKDLSNALRHCDHLALESAVHKFNNTNEYKIVGFNYSHEYYGPYRQIGTLTSSVNIENVAKENGFEYTRYDDQDLNSEDNISYYYDWKEMNNKTTPKYGLLKSWWDNPYCEGRRRFWLISKNISDSKLGIL